MTSAILENAMIPTLSTSFFVQNRATLRAKCKQCLPLIIAGNGLMQRTSDTTYAFSQDSNMWYLTGLDIPDIVLVITDDEDYLIVPERSEVRMAFDGMPDDAFIAARAGITRVLDDGKGWEHTHGLLSTTKRVGYLKPMLPYESAHGFYANPARRRVAEKIRRRNPHIELEDIRPVLAGMRCIKQTEELQCLEAAVSITKETIAELRASVDYKTMRYEYEIEAAITHGFRRRGATGHAYNPIIAAGKNATTLHYDKNNALITGDELIVADVGAQVEHYAADITRTLSLHTPSKHQQAVYDAVADIQKQVMQLFKPGAYLRDIEHATVQLIGEHLHKLGFLKLDANEKVTRRYYPHSVSHFLGLDVHDVGDYNQPLTPGMVLTCEPGIYIPEEGVGVRIEDDLVITDQGHRVL